MTSGVDRSGAVCYMSRCADEPTHRVRWERGDRWYGICEDCAEGIPLGRGTVLEGLAPETITTHPVATDGGTDSAGTPAFLFPVEQMLLLGAMHAAVLLILYPANGREGIDHSGGGPGAN